MVLLEARVARDRASSPAARCARVLESAGIQDILTKSLGTKNPYNVLRATIAGAQAAQERRDGREARGKTVEDLQAEVTR